MKISAREVSAGKGLVAGTTMSDTILSTDPAATSRSTDGLCFVDAALKLIGGDEGPTCRLTVDASIKMP